MRRLSENDSLLKRRFFLAVISIVMAAFMSKIDTFIVSVSLPQMARYFNTTVDSVSRIVLFNLLSGAGSLLFFGKMSDLYGAKKVLIAGFAVFMASSLLCSFPRNIDYLVFFRLIQGLGAAMLGAASFSAIPRFIPKEINGWAYGMVSMGAAVGIAAGAPAGGLIVNHFSWRWIFLVNIPLGLLAIAITLKALPEEKTVGKRIPVKMSRLDIPGALLSFVGISLLLYALSIADNAGWTSVKFLFLILCAVISLILFYICEKKSIEPVFDFKMFSDKRFLYSNASLFFGIALMSGVQLLIPFYLEYSLGLNPLFSGLVMASYPVVYFMTSLFAGPASDIIHPPTLVFVGIVLGGVASLAFSIFLKLDMILITICFMMILGVCFGLFFSPGNKYMMSIPKPENLGAASGAISTVGLIGASVGLVVFETVFSLSMPPHDSFLHGKSSVEGFSRSLDGAFSNTLVAGTILCIISAAFAAYLIMRKRADNT